MGRHCVLFSIYFFHRSGFFRVLYRGSSMPVNCTHLESARERNKNGLTDRGFDLVDVDRRLRSIPSFHHNLWNVNLGFFYNTRVGSA
jgi:hypothetical protein